MAHWRVCAYLGKKPSPPTVPTWNSSWAWRCRWVLTGQPGRRVLSLPGELSRAWHLVMACCYHSRSRGTAHGIFRPSLARYRRNSTPGVLQILWSFGSSLSPPLIQKHCWDKVMAVLCLPFPGIREPLGSVCFFYLKMQKQSGNQQTELIINKKLQV